MATEAEKQQLHEKAELLRGRVTSWVTGPRLTAVHALADELDVIAGYKDPPDPASGSEQEEGDSAT